MRIILRAEYKLLSSLIIMLIKLRTYFEVKTDHPQVRLNLDYCEENGNDIGSSQIDLHIEDGHAYAELMGFDVFLPGKGYGRRFYKESEATLREMGISEVRVFSFPHSKGFWKKMGFKKTTEYLHYVKNIKSKR